MVKKVEVTAQQVARLIEEYAATGDTFTYADLRKQLDATPETPRGRRFRAAWESLKARQIIREVEGTDDRKRHRHYEVVSPTKLHRISGLKAQAPPPAAAKVEVPTEEAPLDDATPAQRLDRLEKAVDRLADEVHALIAQWM